FGIYRMEIYFGEWTPGLSVGPPPGDLKLSVGVLWNEHLGRVWVDTNGDGSFLGEKALGDYSKTHDLNWFGQKSGVFDNRLPFGVEIDRSKRAAYISLGRGFHGSAVAG